MKKIPHKMTIHGHTRVDNYYWLNERENPDVLEYLKAENAYQEAMMKHTEPLQKQLFDEIVGRIKKDDMSVPVKHHGYWYYTRYEEGMEYPLYCRKPALSEEIYSPVANAFASLRSPLTAFGRNDETKDVISSEVEKSPAEEQVLLDGSQCQCCRLSTHC